MQAILIKAIYNEKKERKENKNQLCSFYFPFSSFFFVVPGAHAFVCMGGCVLFLFYIKVIGGQTNKQTKKKVL